MIGSRSTLIVTAASAVLFVVAVTGCKSKDEGEVRSRTQDQEVRPDGTAVQTRTQVRDTPSGTVQETQTQERKPLTPGADTTSGTRSGTGTTGSGTTGSGTRSGTTGSGTRTGSGTGSGTGGTGSGTGGSSGAGTNRQY